MDPKVQLSAPEGEQLKQLFPAGTAGAASGTIIGVPVVVSVALDATSTATGNFKWINPENGTVAAGFHYILTGAAGTGNLNVGRSSDGTGSNNQWVATGTLTAGIHADEPLNGVVPQLLLLGPGGTGTNNSIVGQLNVSQSTMGPCIGFVTYYRIGT